MEKQQAMMIAGFVLALFVVGFFSYNMGTNAAADNLLTGYSIAEAEAEEVDDDEPLSEVEMSKTGEIKAKATAKLKKIEKEIVKIAKEEQIDGVIVHSTIILKAKDNGRYAKHLTNIGLLAADGTGIINLTKTERLMDSMDKKMIAKEKLSAGMLAPESTMAIYGIGAGEDTGPYMREIVHIQDVFPGPEAAAQERILGDLAPLTAKELLLKKITMEELEVLKKRDAKDYIIGTEQTEIARRGEQTKPMVDLHVYEKLNSKLINVDGAIRAELSDAVKERLQDPDLDLYRILDVVPKVEIVSDGAMHQLAQKFERYDAGLGTWTQVDGAILVVSDIDGDIITTSETQERLAKLASSPMDFLAANKGEIFSAKALPGQPIPPGQTFEDTDRMLMSFEIGMKRGPLGAIRAPEIIWGAYKVTDDLGLEKNSISNAVINAVKLPYGDDAVLTPFDDVRILSDSEAFEVTGALTPLAAATIITNAGGGGPPPQ